MEGRTNVSKDGEISHVNFQENVTCTPDGSTTLLELFLSRCEISGNDDFLGTIVDEEVRYRSFREVRELVERLSSFLNGLVKPKEMIGIYSVNRYEWIVSEMAIYMSSCMNVPLYSTFSPSAIKLVLGETEMRVCVASADKARSLLENVLKGSGNEALEYVILMDEDAALTSDLLDAGVKSFYFGDIVKKSADNPRASQPTGEDLATICYTSGTSGSPKGVMLSHRNFIANVAAISRGSTEGEMIRVTKDDVYLSYLPLAHVMERICVAVGLASGFKVAFYRGNPKTIQADYLAIKPTFIASVPRVLNLFKEKIEAQVQKKSFVLRGIFNLALRYKIWRQGSGVFRSPVLDWLIFDKVSAGFGGKIRMVLCGSASLKPEVLRFLQATLSCHIFQGYGQTEGVGSNILKPLDCYEFDNVGIPFPSNKVKLRRVPGYDECSGEILLKGDGITSGYYRRPEQTKELFTEDGWMQTGDIARFQNGVFSIIGRRKEIFKTSLGEYISPEKLEILYTDEQIPDICITGSPYSDHIAAIAFCPDETKSVEDVLAHIIAIGQELFEKALIAKFEIPSRVIVIRKPFESFNNGDFMTPTVKKRRQAIEMHFRREIEDALQNK